MWYHVLLAVGSEGELLTKVWQRDDASRTAEYRRTFGEGWAERDWRFEIGVSRSTLTLDTFSEISFSDLIPPTALPPQISAIVSDARELYHEPFDQVPSDGWDHRGGTRRISQGTLEMIGPEGWHTSLDRARSLQSGEGVLLLFRYSAGAEFDTGVWAGEPETPTWWTLILDHNWQYYVQRGVSWSKKGGLVGNLRPRPDEWYYLLYAVDREGRIVIQAWERDDPSQTAAYRWDMGTDWDELPWYFGLSVTRNAFYMDAFTEFSFSELE
jgi:hypothetical protein